MNAEKWHNSEIHELLYYTFVIHSAGERIFKTGEVTGKIVDYVIYPIRLALLSSKMQISPDKLNNLCITDKNCY